MTFSCRSLCLLGISFKLGSLYEQPREDSVQLLRASFSPSNAFPVHEMHLGLSVCPFSSELTYVSVSHSRPFSCSSREEMLLLQHHPSPRCGVSGCKAGGGVSIPGRGLGPLDPPRQASRTPCPRPLPSGAQGHLPDTRAAPPSSALPASGPLSYCSQAAAAQPCTPAGTPKNGGHWPAQPPSPERRKEEGAGTRPSPPWVKRAHAVREDSLPEDGTSPGCASPKHYPKPQALPSPSSTSDPDTPLGAPGTLGRVSLRISGSAPLASLPPLEDNDDQVFDRDLRSTASSGPACEAPPPPSWEAPAQNLDRFPSPPPEAVCAEQWDSEDYREPHAR